MVGISCQVMAAVGYDSLTEKSTALKDLCTIFICINYADVHIHIVIGINFNHAQDITDLWTPAPLGAIRINDDH